LGGKNEKKKSGNVNGKKKKKGWQEMNLNTNYVNQRPGAYEFPRRKAINITQWK